MTTTTRSSGRLETIATRQRKNRLRDAMFAVCVTIVTALSIATVSAASHAARTSIVQR
jgi:hypothetical protein